MEVVGTMLAWFLTGRWPALAAVLVASSGCGTPDDSSRVAASGLVDVAGREAPDGTISFAPLGPAGGPAAVTSVKAGRYCFTARQGPPPGRHRVLFIAEEGGKQRRFDAAQDAAAAAAAAPGRWQTEVEVPDQAACDLPVHLE
ncbi:MAG TPA: hypothetical protein VHC19_05860 [Pirellulales bacterium]|nr:hypothetical protein [Pirellulales bacterium]